MGRQRGYPERVVEMSITKIYMNTFKVDIMKECTGVSYQEARRLVKDAEKRARIARRLEIARRTYRHKEFEIYRKEERSDV